MIGNIWLPAISGIPGALFIGAASRIAPGPLLPRWLTWTGFVLTPSALAFRVGGQLVLAGRMVLLVSIVLLRGSPAAQPSGASRGDSQSLKRWTSTSRTPRRVSLPGRAASRGRSSRSRWRSGWRGPPARVLGERRNWGTLLYDLAWWAIAVSWAVVGALVAARQPQQSDRMDLLRPDAVRRAHRSRRGVRRALLRRRRWLAGDRRVCAWFANWTWIPAVLVPLVYVPLYFPDGRLPLGWRVVAWVGGLGIAAFAFSEAFTARELFGREIQNPYGIDHVAVDLLGFGSILTLGAVVAGVVSVIIRFRRAEGIERQQIKWLAYAACLAATLLVLGGLGAALGIWSDDVANAFILLAVLSLPLAVGIAILRYRLYDIDLLINRTLVYGSLTVGVVAIYVLLVGGLAALVQESADFWLALVATGLVALLVPAIALDAAAPREPADVRGRRRPAWPRSSGRLHEAFVPEAAELQRARERLVAAREEERRRLRRDLHDGLGPALAGAALKVEAAENLLASDGRRRQAARGRTLGDPERGRRRAPARCARPPALDELGLVEALREQAEKLGMTIRVEIDASDQLEGLPAAVEVAAYRISLEAMTNAARHADARTCVVRIAQRRPRARGRGRQGGPSDDYCTGIGISSMREQRQKSSAGRARSRLWTEKEREFVPDSPSPRRERRSPSSWRTTTLFRDGLRALLASVDDAPRGARPRRAGGPSSLDLQPDVVLMDLHAPEVNGIEATRRVVEASPHVGVLVLTMVEDDDAVFAAMRAGALGCLVKGSSQGEILAAIRAVGSGRRSSAPPSPGA